MLRIQRQCWFFPVALSETEHYILPEEWNVRNLNFIKPLYFFAWQASNPSDKLLMFLCSLFFPLQTEWTFSSIYLHSFKSSKRIYFNPFHEMFFLASLSLQAQFLSLFSLGVPNIVIAHRETCTGGTYFGCVEPETQTHTHTQTEC